jgi:uncharacterized membrane protein
MDYLTLKWLHVLSSTVLFGTGLGSAFYLLVVTLSRDVGLVAAITRWVVVADWLFTATTAVLQPLTGLWMVRMAGMPLATPWIAWSLGLYAFAVACWLPVVWIQVRLRAHADTAAGAGHAVLPPAYWRLFIAWVVLGLAAFFAFLAIFWLMVAKQVPWAA